MANGHGGLRAGAGRPRKPVTNDNGPAPKATVEPKVPRPLFSQESVEAIINAVKERAGASRMLDRSKPENNPYRIFPEKFGPIAAFVKDKHPKIAMDQNTALMGQNGVAVQAWQAGGLLGNVVSEGLLFLGYPYLSELAQRPEFRLVAEIRAEEMVRKWTRHRGTSDESNVRKGQKENQDDRDRATQRKRDGDKPKSDARNREIEDKIKELRDFEDELKVRDWFKAAAAQDNFFGISHLLIDRTDTKLDDPNDPNLKVDIGNGRNKVSESILKGKKKWLKGFRTIEPIWVYPMAYNAVNPLLPSWYDPQQWYVMGTEVHKSQLLQFIGRPVPDILKPAYMFGGLSMTQMAQPYVDIWLKTRMSVGDMIHAFSVMVLATNLATTTMPGGSGGGNGDVIARTLLFAFMRDNAGVMVVDKNTEDLKNVSAPLGGLGELQQQSLEHICTAVRIPVVKYTGNQPMGLNATGEGELRAFEETVAGMQEHLFRARLTTVYDFMQWSLWGERDPDITYDFLPLREETPKEKAEIRKLEAETDQVRIDSGVVWQEEARKKLAMDPESGYDSIEPEDVPDLLEEESEGLIPEGAGRGLEAELEIEGEGAEQPNPKPEAKPQPKKRPAAKDEPTLSHTEAGYVAPWADGDTQCQRCTMFVKTGACMLVRGTISRIGHCDHFAAKGAKDDRPAPGETRRNTIITGGGELAGQDRRRRAK